MINFFDIFLKIFSKTVDVFSGSVFKFVDIMILVNRSGPHCRKWDCYVGMYRWFFLKISFQTKHLPKKPVTLVKVFTDCVFSIFPKELKYSQNLKFYNRGYYFCILTLLIFTCLDCSLWTIFNLHEGLDVWYTFLAILTFV